MKDQKEYIEQEARKRRDAEKLEKAIQDEKARQEFNEHKTTNTILGIGTVIVYIVIIIIVLFFVLFIMLLL